MTVRSGSSLVHFHVANIGALYRKKRRRNILPFGRFVKRRALEERKAKGMEKEKGTIPLRGSSQGREVKL